MPLEVREAWERFPWRHGQDEAEDGQDEAQEGQEEAQDHGHVQRGKEREMYKLGNVSRGGTHIYIYMYAYRGSFFGVAPPIYTRVCIYPRGNGQDEAQEGQEEAQDGQDGAEDGQEGPPRRPR